MSDLIKREDAIEVAYQLRHKPNDDEWNWWLRSFNAIPTIDAVEVVRGEWVKRTHDTLIAQVNFAYCSECGQPIMHEHTRPLWSCCPNCGAKMKGADDE